MRPDLAAADFPSHAGQEDISLQSDPTLLDGASRDNGWDQGAFVVVGAEANDFAVANLGLRRSHELLTAEDVKVLLGIAREGGIPKEHWETINTSADRLRELFDQVHHNIDNKVDPGFGSVEQQMAQRLAELETIAQR